VNARPFADAALRYAGHGWCVFPLAVRDKKPLLSEKEGGQGFKDATADAERVRTWIEREPCANVGLWPGVSNLCVIDVDGPKGEAGAETLGLLESPSLMCITGRDDGGRHLYFRRPDFTLGNVKAIPHGLDVRCDAGYVVLPPSVHPLGTVYRWQGRASDIAPLPVRALAVLHEAQQQLEAPAPPPPPLPSRLPTSDEMDRRVHAYVACVGQCAEGDGRNNLAFQFSAWLLNDMALPIEQAWPYVVEWNASNAPPLDARELRNTFKSALKHGRRPMGCGLERQQPMRPRQRSSFSIAAWARTVAAARDEAARC
jgi:hypothetical protein